MHTHSQTNSVYIGEIQNTNKVSKETNARSPNGSVNKSYISFWLTSAVIRDVVKVHKTSSPHISFYHNKKNQKKHSDNVDANAGRPGVADLLTYLLVVTHNICFSFSDCLTVHPLLLLPSTAIPFEKKKNFILHFFTQTIEFQTHKLTLHL